MKKRFITILNNDKGISNTLQVLFGSLIFCMFLAVGISAIGLTNEHVVLEDFADELTAKVGELGKCESIEIDKKYDELCIATGLSPKIDISADYYNSNKKTVQYGDPITINVSYKTKFIGIDKFYIPIDINVTKTTQSEQYWK